MSQVKLLMPSQGVAGMKEFDVRVVDQTKANPLSRDYGQVGQRLPSTYPSGLPVAVNIFCHATRHKTTVLYF